jgi:hypothetical protein
MDTPGIRETICAALRTESDSGLLRQRLEQQLPQLRELLILPEEKPVDALMAFIFHDYAAPFLHMAEDYFLQPPDELPTDGGLEALLDEAFLAHRLLEEVNDHHIRHLQRPLLPVDMTEANIIVHHLLGDEFATRLEQLVQFTASQLLEREHVWDRVRALPGGEETPSPVLSSNNLAGSPQQIRLRLAS